MCGGRGSTGAICHMLPCRATETAAATLHASALIVTMPPNAGCTEIGGASYQGHHAGAGAQCRAVHSVRVLKPSTQSASSST